MLKVRYSAQFKKDFKLAKKRGLPLQELKDILEMLALEKPLDENITTTHSKGNMFLSVNVIFARIGS